MKKATVSFVLAMSLALPLLAKPTCANVGTRSEGWYDEKGLIGWDNCEGQISVCRFIDSDSEGWYAIDPAYPDDIIRLIQYEVCGDQSNIQ